MREILFRGKRDPKYGEGWCFGVPYIDYDSDYILANDFSKLVVVEETVGQYTGLRDKNGKRIFEGDILTLEGCIYPIIVYWNDEDKRFYVDDTSEGFLVMDFRDIVECEVIGNVHDNPELLQNVNRPALKLATESPFQPVLKSDDKDFINFELRGC